MAYSYHDPRYQQGSTNSMGYVPPPSSTPYASGADYRAAFQRMQAQRARSVAAGTDPYKLADGTQRNPDGRPTYGIGQTPMQQTMDPSIQGVQGSGMQPQVMPGTGGYGPEDDGMMYAGGSKWFDESGGGYTGGPNYTPQTMPGAPDPFAGFRVEQLDPSRAFVTPGGISELLNPYQQQVRDQTMSDIERQRQLAQITTDDQANAAKAFGGNRHGVANALTNDAFAREAGRQYANLNSQGWNTAATLNQANAGNYLSARGQDINQNQGFMQGALQQRQQDTGYAMGQTSNLINAFQVGNNLMNSSGNMDWNSLNQGSSAINGPSNQASTTQDGGSTWNNLFGNLLTGISLVYRG